VNREKIFFVIVEKVLAEVVLAELVMAVVLGDSYSEAPSCAHAHPRWLKAALFSYYEAPSCAHAHSLWPKPALIYLCAAANLIISVLKLCFQSNAQRRSTATLE
jgi:hypothetical protein